MISNERVVDLRKNTPNQKPTESSKSKPSWNETVSAAINQNTEPEIEKKQENNEQDGILREWQTLEFIKYTKNPYFLPIGLIFTAVIVGAAIIFKNFFLAVFIVLSALIWYFYSEKEPRIINIKISKTGIWMDQTFYPFENLKSFWIFDNDPDFKEISFIGKKTFMRPLRFFLNNQDPKEIREILLNFLKEEKQEKSFSDFLASRF